MCTNWGINHFNWIIQCLLFWNRPFCIMSTFPLDTLHWWLYFCSFANAADICTRVFLHRGIATTCALLPPLLIIAPPCCCRGTLRATMAAGLIIKHHCQSLFVLEILQYVSILRVHGERESREKHGTESRSCYQLNKGPTQQAWDRLVTCLPHILALLDIDTEKGNTGEEWPHTHTHIVLYLWGRCTSSHQFHRRLP